MTHIQGSTLSAEPLNAEGSETPAAGWPRYRYRLTGKRKGSTVAVNPVQHPDPAAAWAAALGIESTGFAEWEPPLEPPAEQPAAEQRRQRFRISPESAARLGLSPLPTARRTVGSRHAREHLAVRQRRIAARKCLSLRSTARPSAVWRRSLDRVHGAVVVRNKRVLNLVQGVEDLDLWEVFIGPHMRASVAQRLADFDAAADGW